MPKLLTDREKYFRSITEASLQSQLIELGRAYGYRVFHTYDSRWTKERGFPDLCFVHPFGDLFFAEVKRELGKLRPEQEEVIEAIQKSGTEVFVWRPSNFDEATTIIKTRRRGWTPNE